MKAKTKLPFLTESSFLNFTDHSTWKWYSEEVETKMVVIRGSEWKQFQTIPILSKYFHFNAKITVGNYRFDYLDFSYPLQKASNQTISYTSLPRLQK
jgi:hypothetical protein